MSSSKQLSLKRVLDFQQKLIEDMHEDPRLDVTLMPLSRVKLTAQAEEVLSVNLIEHLLQVRIENVHIIIGITLDGELIKLNTSGTLTALGFSYSRLLGAISGMVDAVDIRDSNRKQRGMATK